MLQSESPHGDRMVLEVLVCRRAEASDPEPEDRLNSLVQLLKVKVVLKGLKRVMISVTAYPACGIHEGSREALPEDDFGSEAIKQLLAGYEISEEDRQALGLEIDDFLREHLSSPTV